MIIIDATDTIAGRLATYAAKQALLGEKVEIINAERAVISGSPTHLKEHFDTRRVRGAPRKGPYTIRLADRFLRRIIRGMLPYKQPRGAEAYKRILCHIGVPAEFEGKKAITLDKAKVEKLPTLNYITLHELCKGLGGKV